MTLTMTLFACSGAVTPESETTEAPLTVYGSAGDLSDTAPQASVGSIHRLRYHGGLVFKTMRVQAIYVGMPHEGGVASRDEIVEWTLTSGPAYWGMLEQYGVGAGKLVGTTRIGTSALVPPSEADAVIPVADLEAHIKALLSSMRSKAGAQVADAYAIFLPRGLSVSFGNRGSKVFRTCVDVGAYHRFDGNVPYAVFPDCELGLSARAISHELAEMATDPVLGTGWIAKTETDNGIGEIGDLCNRAVDEPIQGFSVTELWSNRDGRCMPAQ